MEIIDCFPPELVAAVGCQLLPPLWHEPEAALVTQLVTQAVEQGLSTLPVIVHLQAQYRRTEVPGYLIKTPNIDGDRLPVRIYSSLTSPVCRVNG